MALKAALADHVADSYEPALNRLSPVTYTLSAAFFVILGVTALAVGIGAFVIPTHLPTIWWLHGPLAAYGLQVLATTLAGSMLLGGVNLLVVAGVLTVGTKEHARRRRAWLAELRSASFPERVKRVAMALREASTLIGELQAELTARTALLEDINRQVAETTERAADMEKLSHVDDETARAMNKYFGEALRQGLDDLEHGSRRREWFIGTIVAVAVGIIAILVCHFLFGL